MVSCACKSQAEQVTLKSSSAQPTEMTIRQLAAIDRRHGLGSWWRPSTNLFDDGLVIFLGSKSARELRARRGTPTEARKHPEQSLFWKRQLPDLRLAYSINFDYRRLAAASTLRKRSAPADECDQIWLASCDEAALRWTVLQSHRPNPSCSAQR